MPGCFIREWLLEPHSHEVTNPHMPNECMSLGSLCRAMEIYCRALWNLTVEK